MASHSDKGDDMGRMSRTKGQTGEREIAAIIADLTGWVVKRRVRQHDGDSDLEGVPGWSVEVKRHAQAQRSDIYRWWVQAWTQARDDERPVLFFRRDRDEWRAVWTDRPKGEGPAGYEWTVESSVARWAQAARECVTVKEAA